MKHPAAILPAFAVLGRTLRARWPLLAGIIVAYGLLEWLTGLGWGALPPASSGLEKAIKAAGILTRGGLWGLLGALFAQTTLAVADRRPLEVGDMIAAVASAAPLLALLVLLESGPSIPVTLWRESALKTASLQQMGLAMMAIGLVLSLIGLVLTWLFGMAVSIRLDRGTTVWGSLRQSAAIARRRWPTVLGAAALTYLIGFIVGLLLSLRFLFIGAFEDGSPPAWFVDQVLWALPIRAVTILSALYWPALYVLLRDQEEHGGVAGTFD